MTGYSGSSQFASLHFTDQNYSSLDKDRCEYLNNYKDLSYARTRNYTLSADDRGGNWRSSKPVPVCHNTKYYPHTDYYTIAWIKDQNRYF